MDVKHEVMYSTAPSYGTSPGAPIYATSAKTSAAHSPGGGGGSEDVKAEMKRHSPCYASESESRPGGHVLFSGIVGVKRLRTDDWLSTKNSLLSSNPVSPLTTNSPTGGGGPTPAAQYSVISANGYPSPTESYPYSPNDKPREDLSPVNGYAGLDNGDLSKKKKGPAARQQEELCLVCGDRASGYHYNALTCEGCKGFFRRSITKNAVYQCKYGNSCEIDMYMRRKCQECRLKKCLSVGMRPECVVPEYQCAVKRKEKKAQKDKNKPNSTTETLPEILKTESNSQQSSDGASSRVSSHTSGTKPVSPEQEELIHRLVYFQNEYEHPSEEDIKKIVGDTPNTHDREFRHITEFTILTVQLIVEFAKRLPGFDKLLREDQISLLKACSSEVMMLRMARRYDAPSDSILFANNQPYTRDSYKSADMGETVDDLLKFCRLMYSMKVDNAEYALLTAIVIFSERPSLTEAWKVEKIQEIYLETLKAYVDNRVRHNSTTIFAKLLSVLTELRTLGNQNSELCFSFKLKNKKLPPFLAEIWDVIT